MLPVTVLPGVFKTLNDRQPEFNKKCEAIKQIFMDHKSNSEPSVNQEDSEFDL